MLSLWAKNNQTEVAIDVVDVVVGVVVVVVDDVVVVVDMFWRIFLRFLRNGKVFEPGADQSGRNKTWIKRKKEKIGGGLDVESWNGRSERDRERRR